MQILTIVFLLIYEVEPPFPFQVQFLLSRHSCNVSSYLLVPCDLNTEFLYNTIWNNIHLVNVKIL